MSSIYPTTPHTDLKPQLETGWLRVVRLLDDPWLSGPARSRMTVVAGQYQGFLAQTAFELGEDAAPYLTLAGQHAAESRDLLLVGSVATLDSSISYFSGSYETAADIAARARPSAHPYVRSYLAACEARAAARAGQPERARAALDDMQATLLPGSSPPGPAAWTEADATSTLATTFAILGDGEPAEAYARQSLASLDGSDRFVEIAGASNALGRAFLHRQRPDPERAADAVCRSLAAVEGRPARTVILSSARLSRVLAGRWPNVPAVRDLREQINSHPSLAPPAQLL